MDSGKATKGSPEGCPRWRQRSHTGVDSSENRVFYRNDPFETGSASNVICSGAVHEGASAAGAEQKSEGPQQNNVLPHGTLSGQKFRRPIPLDLKQINFEMLQISKFAFWRKTRLSLLSIPVWLRCRQRGQPFGLPSVASQESTPRCSRCLYALWATGTAQRAARRVGLRGAPHRVRR